jgi:transcriptional regulator with PAS, ATPase and Fis domain
VHKSGALFHTVFENKILGTQKSTISIQESDKDEPISPFQTDLQHTKELPPLKEVESMLIKEALRRAKGNQTLAAKMLNVSRKTLNTRVLKM